ncbi:MAG: flagellar basal-body rod protein FlgF [Syntrophomonadaceae bacterium]|nr:flagellar basal-body rod protein FlgF [Syntrophomonadaceae bacterium]
MIRGLYTASSGMMLQMVRQDVLANNLANVNTSGFKKDMVIAQEFPAMLLKRMGEVTRENSVRKAVKPEDIGSLGTGATVQQIVTDYSNGTYKATENPFDLALDEGCFFCIETPAGVRYTRNGAFSVDAERRLVNASGQPVLGLDGPILVEGDFVVDERGNIIQDGVTVDTLRIVSFPNPNMLAKIGNDLYAAEGQEPETPENPRVLQGYLELSNVNAVREMVDLITVVRSYEVMQKVIQSQDQTLDKLINQVGR